MFIDASALVAILLAESEAMLFVRKLEAAKEKLSSPLAVWETAVAISRGLRIDTGEATSIVKKFLGEMKVSLIAVQPETAVIALGAREKFGKGRHPAALNFGDCFAYACAKHLKMPLLYKGDDFALTDIRAA